MAFVLPRVMRGVSGDPVDRQQRAVEDDERNAFSRIVPIASVGDGVRAANTSTASRM